MPHAAKGRTAASLGSKRMRSICLFRMRSSTSFVVNSGRCFFPDRTKGYREANRVLRPGGSFIFNVWDKIEDNVFANDVTMALAELFSDDPPRFLARTPHGYHDEKLIENELQSAGYSRVTIERTSKLSSAPSPLDVAIAYCQGTPVRNEIEARGVERLQAATEHAAAAIAKLHGNGEVSAKIQALTIVAEKAASSV